MSTKLPRPVAACIQATNDHDSAAFLASFTEDALVNDIQREFWGKAAIGKWAEREIFGAKGHGSRSRSRSLRRFNRHSKALRRL